MRDHSSSQSTEQTQTPTWQCPAPVSAEPQLAGNQAAQADLTYEAPSLGFMDGLMDLAAPEGASHDWSAPQAPEAHRDELVADQLDLHALPALSDASGAVQASEDGLSITQHSQTETDTLLGKASSSAQNHAAVESDGTLRMGRGHGQTESDGDFAVHGGVRVGTDGAVTASGAARVADVGVAGSGTVDVDADGRIEQVAADGKVSLGDNELAAGVQVEPGTVKLEGNTVSYESSFGATAAGKVAGIEAGVAHAQGQRETRTFSTPEQARVFAAQAREQGVKNNRELGADEVAAMPEGTSFSYSAHAASEASLFAARKASDIQEVEVVCGEGDKVTLTLRSQSDDRIEAGVENSFLGAKTETNGRNARSEQVYELDLAVAAQRADFERLQQQGALPTSVEPVRSEQMQGEHDGRSATLPGMAVSQQSSEEEGERLVNGQRTRVHTGTASSGVMDLGWSMFPYAAAKAMDFAAAIDFDTRAQEHYAKAARGFRETGDAWYEEGLQDGSQAGFERNQVQVLTPGEGTDEERLAAQRLVLTQVMDFDDKQQASRCLHDAVEPGTDREGVDPTKLPAAGKDAAKWVLESEVDALGTARVRDQLQSGLVGHELGAARNLEWLRDSYYHADMTPEDHAKAIAVYGRWGDEDGVEAMRHDAGEEHVENYLYKEGDDTWIGRDASGVLDDVIAEVVHIGDSDRARSLLASEEARLARLMNPDLYQEVPLSLIDEEVVRTTARVENLRRLGAS